MNDIRIDHKFIIELIEPNSHVLDLGCGDGTLLDLLAIHKNCKTTGIEINEKEIYKCVERGVTVSHGDIDSGLEDYLDKRFDYVILNESLQEILNPERVISEALRVGKRVIVGIPNFCNISARLQILLFGQVPVTKGLPYKWYNTPNLRFLSIKDFRYFCRDRNIIVERERAIGINKEVFIKRNLFAYACIFLIRK